MRTNKKCPDKFFNLSKKLPLYSNTGLKCKCSLFCILSLYVKLSPIVSLHLVEQMVGGDFPSQKQQQYVSCSNHDTESSLSSIHVSLQWLACDLPFFLSFFFLRNAFFQEPATACGGHKRQLVTGRFIQAAKLHSNFILILCNYKSYSLIASQYCARLYSKKNHRDPKGSQP